jgi:hypothetical protein
VKPYKVLCTYHPSKWRASLVGRDLTAITRELGLLPHKDDSHGPLHLTGRNWVDYALHAEVRRRTFSTAQAEGWHWDSDLDPNGNPDCVIVTWASNNGTQIKWKDWPLDDMANPEASRIWQPRPYELVAFRNLSCLHRRPPGCPRVRWLMRQRCDIASAAHLYLP